MKVKLKVLQGSQAGKEIGVSAEGFVIGRSSECQLRARSDLISRRHCEIVIENGEVRLRDFGSRNGTYVNDERVDGESRLSLGDHLRIGRMEFEILIDHSLGGSKRPKVQSVKEAVSRTTDDRVNKEDDISKWLDEADDTVGTKNPFDPETRQFKLDDTDRVALEAAAHEQEEAAEDPKGQTGETKSQPGKLPKRNLVGAKDSSQAASDMLKKMFGRR